MNVIIRNAFVIIGVIIGLIVATILGIYAQNISYYFNERFPTIELITFLTLGTFLSIGLYIMIPIILFVFKKIGKVYIVVFWIVGIPISLWSFFVWAMWLG